MLTGQAKKDYQREYMKSYMKGYRVRAVKTQEVVKTRTALRPVKTQTKQEKLVELRGLLNTFTEPVTDEHVDAVIKVIGRPPLYNPKKHKKGDTVRMPGGEIVVVPEMDELGNVLEAF